MIADLLFFSALKWFFFFQSKTQSTYDNESDNSDIDDVDEEAEYDPSIDVISLLNEKENDSKPQDSKRNQITYTNSNKFRPKFNPPRGNLKCFYKLK